MEIERKFRIESFDLVREKIVSLGFTFVKKKHQIDTYYIVREKMPSGKEKYLRIRKNVLSGEISLDMHLYDITIDASEEIEVAVDSNEAIVAILGQLGLSVVCVVNKKREVYSLDGVTVVLDDVAGLGLFCEVEIVSDASSEVDALIEKVRVDLGLLDEVEDAGYPDLMVAKKN